MYLLKQLNSSQFDLATTSCKWWRTKLSWWLPCRFRNDMQKIALLRHCPNCGMSVGWPFVVTMIILQCLQRAAYSAEYYVYSGYMHTYATVTCMLAQEKQLQKQARPIDPPCNTHMSMAPRQRGIIYSNFHTPFAVCLCGFDCKNMHC